MSVIRRPRSFLQILLNRCEAHLLLRALAIAREDIIDSAHPAEVFTAGLLATRFARLRDRLLREVARQDFQLDDEEGDAN